MNVTYLLILSHTPLKTEFLILERRKETPFLTDIRTISKHTHEGRMVMVICSENVEVEIDKDVISFSSFLQKKAAGITFQIFFVFLIIFIHYHY